MNNLFNSPFENALRVLLLLSFNRDRAFSTDMITALDFIALYGKEFGITDSNLNGDNTFSSCEYTAKRNIIQEAIKLLVLRNLISADYNPFGFYYSITENGLSFVKHLNTDYAKEYIATLIPLYTFTKNKTEQQLVSFIHEIAKLKIGDGNE